MHLRHEGGSGHGWCRPPWGAPVGRPPEACTPRLPGPGSQGAGCAPVGGWDGCWRAWAPRQRTGRHAGAGPTRPPLLTGPQVAHAEQAGAVATIVYDDVFEPLVLMAKVGAVPHGQARGAQLTAAPLRGPTAAVAATASHAPLALLPGSEAAAGRL